MNIHKASILLSLIFLISACAPQKLPDATSTSMPTSTVGPTATDQPTATKTLVPTSTPRPNATPNLAATQKYDGFNQEIQSYYDAGYVAGTDGSFKEFDNFTDEWAQLGWYQWYPLGREVSSFSLSAHFKWMSAYKNADESGCGFAFAIQPDFGHYAVFLDRNKIIFLDADSSYGSYARSVGKTSGSGRVKFDNPAEADFTLIVNGIDAYVLVNNELIGKYTLSKSRILQGDVGLTVLSGTNKDYGTRCEMTDIHLFAPK
ncbi:MAG TPA: hypothetical protein VF896_09425 [Anaerolineales bacterium]